MNENLLRDLEDGTCALVLGPEFHLTNSKNEEAITSLRDYLFETEKLKVMPYLSEDGFFYLRKDTPTNRVTQKKNIVNAIRDYYDELKQSIPDYYISVARLPFFLIISLSPDEMICDAFDEIRKPYDYRFFAMGEYCDLKKMKKEIENDPSSERPLIFNLLGSHKNWESMVFTHDSLFEFLYNLFPLEKLSQKFKSSILNASSFLFLGFKYDKWYLKLIFFLLQKIRGNKGTENLAIYTGHDKFSKVKDFYTDEMAFSFNEVNVYQFINELYDEARRNNIIYKTPEPTANIDNPTKFKILYICAVPDEFTATGSDREFANLQKLCLLSGNNDQFSLIPVFASTKKDMLNNIEAELPNFVVISGHGNPENELLFINEHGEADPFPLEEWQETMNLLVKNPRCNLSYIFFNCCNSEAFAAAMVNYVSFSIGMKGVIGVDASLDFSDGFFRKFFNERNFSRAFDFGKLNINTIAKYKDTPQYFESDKVKK
jgi:hypothetical protein